MPPRTLLDRPGRTGSADPDAHPAPEEAPIEADNLEIVNTLISYRVRIAVLADTVESVTAHIAL